jgi:pimeloyl-ACP methyl ester carboxylesterase
MMRSVLSVRKILFGLIVLLSTLALGFAGWAETPLGPEDVALKALQSDDKIRVVRASSRIEFLPRAELPRAGLILYPGGRVDHRSYAPLARQIAQYGYLVVIVRMPLNLAVLGLERAGPVIDAHPGIEKWAVGGHSLGGAMAAAYAQRNAARVGGLALLAAYPPDSSDLSNLDIEVVSIFGSQDSILSAARLENTRHLLPEGTRWVEIEGGNHAGFGWYGSQPGDTPAGISRQEQQDLTVQAVVELLERLK